MHCIFLILIQSRSSPDFSSLPRPCPSRLWNVFRLLHTSLLFLCLIYLPSCLLFLFLLSSFFLFSSFRSYPFAFYLITENHIAPLTKEQLHQKQETPVHTHESCILFLPPIFFLPPLQSGIKVNLFYLHYVKRRTVAYKPAFSFIISLPSNIVILSN